MSALLAQDVSINSLLPKYLTLYERVANFNRILKKTIIKMTSRLK